jgi:hypothetical protein
MANRPLSVHSATGNRLQTLARRVVTTLASTCVRRAEIGGDDLRQFPQVSEILASGWSAWRRLQPDLESSGRRFKSCLPDQKNHS